VCTQRERLGREYRIALEQLRQTDKELQNLEDLAFSAAYRKKEIVRAIFNRIRKDLDDHRQAHGC